MNFYIPIVRVVVYMPGGGKSTTLDLSLSVVLNLVYHVLALLFPLFSVYM